MSDSEDHIDDMADDGGDDLFGGDDGDDVTSQASEPNGRVLSDRDLASEHGDANGYDEDERRQDDDEEDVPVRHINVEKVAMYRHRIPKANHDQLISFRVPQFLKFHPEEYKPESFEPTKWDTDNAQSAAPASVVRYRRDAETGKMQSNANVYRWSDGSVTMAVGDEHYEIQTKDLAPPSNKPYNELKDAHYYTAAANLSSNTLMIVGHLTEQYTVRPNKEFQDDAVEILQQQLSEAQRAKNTDIIAMVTEDPELQKKQAEMAEKERNRAQRKREAAAARLDGVGNRQSNRGALSIGELEGGSRRGGAGGRKTGGAAPKKRSRNNEYDSDDDLPRGVGRHDEYEEDDFVVGSGEEEASTGDDDEEEEILDDGDEEEEDKPKRKRQRTAEPDEDAEGEDDDAPAASKPRRRRVVTDDEDEV